jgi:predicted PurR-regulated permease PerM
MKQSAQISATPAKRSFALRTLLLTTLLVGLILAVADLLIVTLSVLLLMFAGVLFAIFLNGLSQWISDHSPVSYRSSYTAVLFVLMAIMAAGVFYLGSQAAQQASALWSEVQTSANAIGERLEAYNWAEEFLPDSSQVTSSITDGSVVPQVMQGVRWATWAFTGFLVIFFVGAYVAFDPELYKTGLVNLVPQDRRDRASQVLRSVHSVLGHWIIGRLIAMSVVGVFTAIGLWLLGVPLPVPLAVLAALLTFVPNIGPIIATVPQALLALQVDTATVVYVIIFNVVLQTFESYLLTPVVQKYEASLPPALTIFAQLLMAVLVGVIGVIMAAPLTAAIMVLVQTLYIQDRLNDPDPGSLT